MRGEPGEHPRPAQIRRITFDHVHKVNGSAWFRARLRQEQGPTSPADHRTRLQIERQVALPAGIKADQVTPHLVTYLLGLPAALRRTFTWDRGREIAGYKAITAAANMPIYLC